MSRRRERANFDGSVSLVRQTHPETPGEDAEATLIRLAKIMEMADDTLNAVWRDSERKQGREKERQKDLDDMQKQLPSSKDPVSETGDGISSILESLKNTNRYGFWCGAVSVCTSSIGEADGKVGIAENLAALWKEAVSTFDRLPDAHGPKFPFGAAVNVAVLMKIRAIEPVVLELVAWSPWTHWRQEIPDSACVTEGLRAKAKEIQQVHYKQRMEELHRPDLGSLIAVQSTLTTAVISTIFCATAFLGVAWHYSTPDIGSPHDMVSRLGLSPFPWLAGFHCCARPAMTDIDFYPGPLVRHPGMRSVGARILYNNVPSLPPGVGLSMALVASLLRGGCALLPGFHPSFPVGSKVLERGSFFYWGCIAGRYHIAAVYLGDAA
ncbi:hypothetical protein B0T16DRAFT_112004 [Cercophora newfieldiana]|uniref:Uncharacterized protein n=1 Tax=Cercophora newfieldiana TaxID=92897 RepID=A0AA39Y8J5_9PEZI|nr:hypothetical protein B0T16DRAFT_112004 [Cercophora newfieldiana]